MQFPIFQFINYLFSGPNTNGSQFFISFQPTNWYDYYCLNLLVISSIQFIICNRLDNKHVVFAHLVTGLDVLKKMEVFFLNFRVIHRKFVGIHDMSNLFM
jgi:cyclophilin family peptidyl-prolyl cis-trans isomerase